MRINPKNDQTPSQSPNIASDQQSMSAGSGDVESLAEALESTSVSESGLSFAGKSLKLNNKEDVKAVTDEIDKCKYLHFLNLEGNTLGVEAAKYLGISLENHPELKRAQWKDLFTGRLKSEIPVALKYLSDGLMTARCHLVELDLSDNAFGEVGVAGVAALIRSRSCHALEELRLNNNGLGVSGAKLLAQALTDCYNLSKEAGKPLQLRVFVAGRNRLENDGAKALAEVFKLITTLEEISIPQNGIYHPGWRAISDALPHNKNLKILNFNDNTIGKIGAKHLAPALTSLENLQVINFGDCLLKTSGTKSIAAALKDNHENLERLILDANEIRTAGAVSVIEAISNKSKLIFLDLNTNTFGSEGREIVKDEMDKIGKLYALGSLEDDESEDEEEYKDESSSDSESSESDDNQEIGIDDFLNAPTEFNFMKLGNERKNIIINESQKTGDIVLEDYIRILMKVSALYGSTDERVRNFSLDIAATLYSNLFSWSARKKNSPYVFNVVFVNLGLIKCEEKDFSPLWDTKNCQRALKALKASDSIPQSVRNIFDIFFARKQ